MNHKWNKQPDKFVDNLGYFKVWICKVCGCRKELLSQRFSEPNYIRNNQIYDRYVSCIDMESKNEKHDI